jgi:hypothetical protein
MITMMKNEGKALVMKNSILKLKSVNVTVLDVPIPRSIQKNTSGNPKQMNVGRLKMPITQIDDIMAHLLYE